MPAAARVAWMAKPTKITAAVARIGVRRLSFSHAMFCRIHLSRVEPERFRDSGHRHVLQHAEVKCLKVLWIHIPLRLGNRHLEYHPFPFLPPGALELSAAVIRDLRRTRFVLLLFIMGQLGMHRFPIDPAELVDDPTPGHP
jgi:hypothetical protein